MGHRWKKEQDGNSTQGLQDDSRPGFLRGAGMAGVKGNALMKPKGSKAHKVGEESEHPARAYHISYDRGIEVAEGQCYSD